MGNKPGRSFAFIPFTRLQLAHKAESTARYKLFDARGAFARAQAEVREAKDEERAKTGAKEDTIQPCICCPKCGGIK
jgi:hypothetical protein